MCYMEKDIQKKELKALELVTLGKEYRVGVRELLVLLLTFSTI